MTKEKKECDGCYAETMTRTEQKGSESNAADARMCEWDDKVGWYEVGGAKDRSGRPLCGRLLSLMLMTPFAIVQGPRCW